MTARERKELKAKWAKLAKIIGNRPAPPVRELERRYREVMGDRSADA